MKITDYFIKMKNIADNMAVVGSALSDDDLILHILCSLGPKYNFVATYITGQIGVGKMNVNEAYAMLLSQEVKIEQQAHMLVGMDVKQNFEANLVQNKGFKKGFTSGSKNFGGYRYNLGFENTGNYRYGGYKGNSGGAGANGGNMSGVNFQQRGYSGDNKRNREN